MPICIRNSPVSKPPASHLPAHNLFAPKLSARYNFAPPRPYYLGAESTRSRNLPACLSPRTCTFAHSRAHKIPVPHISAPNTSAHHLPAVETSPPFVSPAHKMFATNLPAPNIAASDLPAPNLPALCAFCLAAE